MYLNGACIAPSVRYRDEETGPTCEYAGIGRTFNLDPLVVLAAPVAYGPNDSYPIYPSRTLDNVHMPPIHTVVPFVFYFIGALDMAIMLVTIPIVFCAEHFAIMFHTALAGVSEHFQPCDRFLTEALGTKPLIYGT